MPDRLGELARRYFDLVNTADPIGASLSGVPGHDEDLPDPGRAADEARLAALGALARDLDRLGPGDETGEDAVTRAMLDRAVADDRAALEHALPEASVTATMTGTLAGLVAALPALPLTDARRAEAYLTRLGRLGPHLDAVARRHRDARADGRTPTALGVRQAITQLDAYLAAPADRDPFLRDAPAAADDPDGWRARAARLITEVVRPSFARYRTVLAEELLPVARPDDRAGIRYIPGGEAGYRAAVAAHTTTELTPELLHRTGLDLIAGLREEFAERGGRALGDGDPDTVVARLRDDPALRFSSAGQITAAAERALRAAEAAVPDWFADYGIAPCVVREMNPAEAADSVLGYYLPPAADGTRPGAHVVNTSAPSRRTRFEYEALAFHESVPGHHLQIAVAQSRTGLPDFRRLGYITAHGEGWGLYAERLADEMGLYGGDLDRLGMVSFDAWRAARLVVDTGIHLYGWSRARAMDYLRANTALSEPNIANEVDRYIAWPGQALAYMVGRLRIRELRDRAAAALGPRFEVKGFHHEVLSHGPVPMDVLGDLVDRWVRLRGGDTGVT